MMSTGRPAKEEAKKHPLHGEFNGEVPWLDGCKEHSRETCLDCPVPLEECPAENPRLHKGGRPAGSKNKSLGSARDDSLDSTQNEPLDSTRGKQ